MLNCTQGTAEKYLHTCEISVSCLRACFMSMHETLVIVATDDAVRILP